MENKTEPQDNSEHKANALRELIGADEFMVFAIKKQDDKVSSAAQVVSMSGKDIIATFATMFQKDANILHYAAAAVALLAAKDKQPEGFDRGEMLRQRFKEHFEKHGGGKDDLPF